MVIDSKDILWLSFKDFRALGYSEKDIDYLKRACYGYRRGEFSAYINMDDPNDKRIILIQYSSIPARAINERNIPSEPQLRELYRTQQLDSIVREHCALNYDKAKNLYTANPHTSPHASELAEQAAWLLWLASLKNKQAKDLQYASLEDLFNKVIHLLAQKDWQRWKCNSVQVLRRKVKPFLKLYKKPLSGNFSDTHFFEALDSLIHKGFGNTNREKLTDSQRAVLFQRYADGDAKPNIEQVYMSYLTTAKEKIAAGEWTEDALVSLSTVKNFLYQDDIQQAYWKARHGKQQFRNLYEIVTKRKRASFANALWIIDGTPCHLYYRDGKDAYARLNVFVVLDAHSWCVLGFYVSDSENHEQVIGALHVAATLTNKLPHQIQSDNGSAVSGYFGRTCIHTISKYYTPATPGNARSKAVESFFKHFNNKVGRFYPGFTHSPVMGKNINSLPNPEALQKQLKENQIQGQRNAINSLHEMFAMWNRLPMKDGAPLDKYFRSVEDTADMQRPLTEEIRVNAFLHMPGDLKQVRGADENGVMRTVQQFIPQTYEYSKEGIEVVMNKVTHNFITDDHKFNKQYIGKRFCIRIDRNKPEQVYLFENTAEGVRPFIYNGTQAVLKAPYLFAQAIVDRQEGEAKKLSDHLNTKKLQEGGVEQTAQKFIELTKIEGTYMKLTPGNAFPKEIMNAAKQSLAEKIINGDTHLITKEKTVVTDTPRIIDRWDNADDTTETTPVPSIKSHSDDNDDYDTWR